MGSTVLMYLCSQLFIIIFNLISFFNVPLSCKFLFLNALMSFYQYLILHVQNYSSPRTRSPQLKGIYYSKCHFYLQFKFEIFFLLFYEILRNNYEPNYSYSELRNLSEAVSTLSCMTYFEGLQFAHQMSHVRFLSDRQIIRTHTVGDVIWSSFI